MVLIVLRPNYSSYNFGLIVPLMCLRCLLKILDGLQAVILWANNYFCTIYLADDSYSWPYRTVKRLHIVIHIVRCMVGM